MIKWIGKWSCFQASINRAGSIEEREEGEEIEKEKEEEEG